MTAREMGEKINVYPCRDLALNTVRKKATTVGRPIGKEK